MEGLNGDAVLNTATFNSTTCGRLEGPALMEELLDYFRAAPHQPYLLTVGTDSRQIRETCSIVSVVAVQRVGRGGRYFWRRFTRDSLPTLRRRMYMEASESLTLASELSRALDGRLEEVSGSLDLNLEIHVDVGHRGPTREMMNEIVGMIRGSGYPVRTKPDAYCAAVVADRHV